MHLMVQKLRIMKEPKDWNYQSPETNGFHTVVSPTNSICMQTHIFRLNLDKNQSYSLKNDSLELNGTVIEGNVQITFENKTFTLNKCDSFYLPANKELTIKAITSTIIFIGGAIYEGLGDFYVRKFDLECADKNIRQTHGASPFRRDVFMTVSQFDNASRLICGITSGDAGAWTSWPPHQHTKDLEEVYCYFDIPKPKFALHLSSRFNGVVEFVHPVSTGSCVVVPEGYHPTVAMPGVKSCYFWVMVAHTPESRRYDLAVNDPEFV
jgi:5-deoxy-glucuronate isomerase